MMLAGPACLHAFCKLNEKNLLEDWAVFLTAEAALLLLRIYEHVFTVDRNHDDRPDCHELRFFGYYLRMQVQRKNKKKQRSNYLLSKCLKF